MRHRLGPNPGAPHTAHHPLPRDQRASDLAKKRVRDEGRASGAHGGPRATRAPRDSEGEQASAPRTSGEGAADAASAAPELMPRRCGRPEAVRDSRPDRPPLSSGGGATVVEAAAVLGGPPERGRPPAVQTVGRPVTPMGGRLEATSQKAAAASGRRRGPSGPGTRGRTATRGPGRWLSRQWSVENRRLPPGPAAACGPS